MSCQWFAYLRLIGHHVLQRREEMRVKLETELADNWSRTNTEYTYDMLVDASARIEHTLYMSCKTQLNYAGRMAGTVWCAHVPQLLCTKISLVFE
jgi:hypothetical protein